MPVDLESKDEPGRLERKEKPKKKNNIKEPPAATQKFCVRNGRHLGHERNVLLETDLSQERYRAGNAGSRLHPIESLFFSEKGEMQIV